MIAIYVDQGGEYRADEYEPTAVFEDGEWLLGGEEWSNFYPPGTPEEVLADQLDGPSTVAVEIEDRESFLAEVGIDAEPSASVKSKQATFAEMGGEP